MQMQGKKLLTNEVEKMNGQVLQLEDPEVMSERDLEALLTEARSLASLERRQEQDDSSYGGMAREYGASALAVSDLKGTYGNAGKHLAEFRKSQRRLERRLRFEGNRGVSGILYRGCRKVKGAVTGIEQDESLTSLIAMHLSLVDNVKVEFGHIVSICEGYLRELVEYEGEISARLETLEDEKSSGQQGAEQAARLSGTLLQYGQQGRITNAKQKIRSEHAVFQLRMKRMDDNRKGLLGSMGFYYALSNKNTIQELSVQLHNLVTYCKGICTNLDGIREHLGKALPVYANGHYIAEVTVDMDSMLRMLGRFAGEIFRKYESGVSEVERLHSRQPLDNMYSGFQDSLAMMNGKGFSHLGNSARYFDGELAKRGY